MYKEESQGELIFLALFAIALIPVGIVVNGLILSFAWAELLMPIFPQLPIISQWQAIGLSTFVGLFTFHLAKTEAKNDSNSSGKAIIAKAVFQWFLLFVIVWLVSLTY